MLSAHIWFVQVWQTIWTLTVIFCYLFLFRPVNHRELNSTVIIPSCLLEEKYTVQNREEEGKEKTERVSSQDMKSGSCLVKLDAAFNKHTPSGPAAAH